MLPCDTVSSFILHRPFSGCINLLIFETSWSFSCHFTDVFQHDAVLSKLIHCNDVVCCRIHTQVCFIGNMFSLRMNHLGIRYHLYNIVFDGHPLYRHPSVMLQLNVRDFLSTLRFNAALKLGAHSSRDTMGMW